MADDKKWVTINGAHVPIEDGKPQFGGDRKTARGEAVTRLRQLAENKRKNDGFKEQGKQSNYFDKDNSNIETVEVDLTADIQKQLDNATPEERRNIAFKYIMDNLRGKYPTKDGRIVAIEKVGAKKIKNTLNEVKIRVIPELDELIKSGQFQYIKADQGDKHKNFVGFAYYKVSFRVGDEVYNGMLNIGIRENGDSTLYELNQISRH